MYKNPCLKIISYSLYTKQESHTILSWRGWHTGALALESSSARIYGWRDPGCDFLEYNFVLLNCFVRRYVV